MNNKKECPLCKCPEISSYPDHNKNSIFYECPICGRYELYFRNVKLDFNQNHLASYIFYHCYSHNWALEYRYNTMRNKEECDKYKSEFESGNNIAGIPIHFDNDMVESWYPKTFSERIDYILLYLNSHISHIGQKIDFNHLSVMSLLFIDRKELDKSQIILGNSKWVWRNDNECIYEAKYMLDYLQEANIIKYSICNGQNEIYSISITPQGYTRIDELQKYTSNGRNVLVAMKFGDDTKILREAIRKGISDAGYIAIFIDEVQHNDFITPELLKYIKDSKFVVADLTHQNNGAYFEEGYAMGLGKPVIQLCSKKTKLHFDIAQKNTILWDKEDDIVEALCNRIKATID